MAKRWRARSGRRTEAGEPVRTVPAPPASGLVEALLAGGDDAPAEAMAELNRWAGWRMAGAATALLFVVLSVQFAFVYLSTALPPLAGALRERQRREEGGAAKTRAAAAALMAWACTRSVIGLVLALSLPPSLEDRSLVLVVSALLIIGSVLLQGLTLRPAVLAAALCEDEEEK
jgi:NhaP-type Na+/H+ or K+/H+ antiporter